MTGSRTYGEACAAAHALELIGDRWALLVVRELLLGPKRFTDLREGLPRVTAPVLSQRLRDLEERGILRSRQLGPVRVQAYELTDWGRDLGPVLVELGRWGRRSPFRDVHAHLGVDGIMLALRCHFEGDAADGLAGSYQVRLDGDDFALQVRDRRLDVTRGIASQPDATIATDPATFMAVIAGRQELGAAVTTGAVEITGDVASFERLLAAMPEVAVEHAAAATA